MTQPIKDEVQMLLSGLVTPDIVVASTSVAALLGSQSIRGSDDRHIEGSRVPIRALGNLRWLEQQPLPSVDFSRMSASGSSLLIMVTKRAGQFRCNRWSDRMQMGGEVECNFARYSSWYSNSKSKRILIIKINMIKARFKLPRPTNRS